MTGNNNVTLNENIKDELKELEKKLNYCNAEITEYIQLKNTLEAMNLEEGFKSQTNIGGNFFMQTKVSGTNHILVDVGKNIYIEFTISEAIKFADFKINNLTDLSRNIREESVKKRALLKLTFMCIGENSNLYTMNMDKN